MAYVNALITQEMQDGVLVVDGEMALKHYNIQAEVLLGKGHQLALDKPLAQCALKSPKYWSTVIQHLLKMLKRSSIFNLKVESSG